MVSKAIGRFLPVSPRKVRSVARLIRGLSAERAMALLKHMPKGSARPMAKVLRSAVANATRLGDLSPERLKISRIMADEGPSARRFRAVPMGRAMMFRKKTCHLTIELDLMREGNRNGS